MTLSEAIVKDHNLSDRAVRMLLLIRTYAWESTGSDCYASQERMASDLGWGKRKLQTAISELLAAGLIARRRTQTTTHFTPQSAQARVSSPRERAVSDRANARIKQTKEPDEEKQTTTATRANDPVQQPAQVPAARQPVVAASDNDIAMKEVAQGVLTRYASVVEIYGKPKPRIKPGDIRRAEELCLRYNDDEIEALLIWSLDHEFWADKTSASFARFAGGIDALAEQMGGDEDITEYETYSDYLDATPNLAEYERVGYHEFCDAKRLEVTR